MNYPLISSGQVQAAAGLAEAVADRYGCVGVISQSAVGTAALLDQTAQELSGRRIRCVRVQGPASGGLASRDLIAQIVARPDPGALTDADLKAGFRTLTEPGEGFRRVALLVSEAHSLLPSALRYVQLAHQASPARLCVVLAGKPGLAAALEGDDFIPLRSAMHMMELSEPAGAGLFDQASALPEPPPQVRAGRSSPLVRLGLAASIIPIVGLIWWRHLPAVPPQDAPSVSASTDAPSGPAAAAAPSAPPAASPPAPPQPAAVSAESAEEPAPPEPVSPASPQAGPAADPAPPVAAATVPEPPASEAPAKPDAPAERSAGVAEPPAAAEPPASEPPAAVAAEPPAPELPATVAAEPPAAPPERGEAPASETNLADTPAPKPAAPAPEAGPTTPGPPAPEPAIAAKPPAPPPPHGTLTVTTVLPAHGGARRAAAPVAVPQAAAPLARPAEDRPNLADEKRCREIVFRAQLGKDPSDADKQFLRNGCRGG